MVIVEAGLVVFMRRSWLLSGSQLHTLQIRADKCTVFVAWGSCDSDVSYCCWRHFPICLPASAESFQSSDSEVWTLSSSNLIKLSNQKTWCQLLLFHWWNSKEFWNCLTGTESFQGENVKEAVQKLHSHGRKCESEKEKWVTDVAGAKGERCHCLTKTKCVSKAANK